ncbi:tryptophan halogenase [Sphingomonas guangdongensis]|uniref:Tryptophan halogenase n=1 Tax=Sphingomonas guangdongensis TaxID=1141890 RepID=A0A285QZV9_9SPHN|nr:tryptophan halogenase family protein [Sphingomonas guangdongensis]SOB87406.1 tryptophan halogenase [Sphingomonas guangdongensis]
MTDTDLNPERVRSICIVGGGSAGWMTAATMARLLGPTYAKITLVESEEIGIVGVGEATIPQMRTFNRMLGIEEDEFIRQTRGSFKLGIQFVDWSRLGHTYFHPFGSYGVNMGGLSFHAYFLRLNQLGEAPDIDAFSLQAGAASHAKFMRSVDAGTKSPLSDIAYAYHFDAGLYARYLRGYAEARGVERREGRIIDVRLDERGHVGAVVLESGERIEADLYVDCSGFRALLIGQALGNDYVDWKHWLPCDRAVAVPCAGAERMEPYTRSTARAAGWQWRIPLQHRIGNGHVYSSAHVSDDEATAVLLANLDGEPLADPRYVPFRTGHRTRVWDRNVVALGLSSGFMEPLESTSLWMIQSGLSRFMAMFPDRGFDQATIDRYNRIILTEYEEIRDFLILHYHATERTDSAFWDYCRTMPIPDRLAEKMRVYRAHGRVFRENEELFNDTSWFAVMWGQLMRPRGYDPVADAMGLDLTRDRLAEIAAVMRNSVDYMPDHRAYIRQHCAAA